MTRQDRTQTVPRTADERTTYEAMLDWYRHGVVIKASGLPQDLAVATTPASATSIAGLVKHLALVEDAWFTHRIAGLPMPEPGASAPWDQDEDWEFHSAREEPLAESLALYDLACARSRESVAGIPLDGTALDREGNPVSLRWVYLHMIEETARHLGHLDVLREQADGLTGS